MESKSEGKEDDSDAGAKGGGGCKGGDAKGSSGGGENALIRSVFDYYVRRPASFDVSIDDRSR